ncbi:unnamed protein product [Paramecium pentaurelia]|uniref:Uncharacterized protein n=1 Tax=Paramecium pentaurelia TaxID=43138 RepID=A0A8S1XAH3_9CILI|nr:unnamed protein product [Paramecium pentaurelia]
MKQALIFKHESPHVKADFHENDTKDPIKILQSIYDQYDAQFVEEIILEELEIPEITPELRDKLQEFPNVHSFGINRCGLQSLTNFPSFKHLVRFQADGNLIKAKQIGYLKKYTELRSISLICNQIDDPKIMIKYLKEMKIIQLNLYGNPMQDYFKLFFDEIPSLIYLDNLQKTGAEVYYDYDDTNELSKQDGYICPNYKEYKS